MLTEKTFAQVLVSYQNCTLSVLGVVICTLSVVVWHNQGHAGCTLVAHVPGPMGVVVHPMLLSRPLCCYIGQSISGCCSACCVWTGGGVVNAVDTGCCGDCSGCSICQGTSGTCWGSRSPGPSLLPLVT